MGLMQVMPETYDGLRARYNLGDDAYDPHDNMMAGTAYLREMYDIYGSPGFLAAYNAGPGRLDDYLTRNRPLPDETRHYVRKIAPYIADSTPNRPSAAGNVAMNQLPTEIPPGPRYPHHHQAPVALAETRHSRPAPAACGADRVSARAAAPGAAAAPRAAAAARAGGVRGPAAPRLSPDRAGHGRHAAGPAWRLRSSAGNWAIQVGAFGKEGQARAAAEPRAARRTTLLAHAHPAVGTVHSSSSTLYRARLTGLSRDAAVQACEKLGRHGACIVLSPESQGS